MLMPPDTETAELERFSVRDAVPINEAPAGLAALAVDSLIDEASLTPKPGLVDARGPGAHADLDIDLMIRSAHSLFRCFEEMAVAVKGAEPSREVREKLAEIGRDGERAMFAATRGVNTHKGAIWSLGLLVAATVISGNADDADEIAAIAGEIARHPDTRTPEAITNGRRATERYGVPGARGEAQQGFPHVVEHGLPTLRAARARGVGETLARLDALLSIMADLDDTCLLHRGGRKALRVAKVGAAGVLRLGGASTEAGLAAIDQLDVDLLALNASPGGSGDLLAATLFLDSLNRLPATDRRHRTTSSAWSSEPWKY